jgi:hypothetical protein
MSHSELFVNQRDYQSPRCEIHRIGIESGLLTNTNIKSQTIDKYDIVDEDDEWI